MDELEVMGQLEQGLEGEQELEQVQEPEPLDAAETTSGTDAAVSEILGAIEGARSEVVGLVSAGSAANQNDGSGAEGVALDAEDIQALEGGTYTVVLAADQWDELRESWQWAKRGMQVYGTVLLCLTLMLAIQLGINIYGAFRSRLDG